MEPLQVDQKIIVFSLVDTFTKLSPNKILENYIKKQIDDGQSNIAIFNLSEPLTYMKDNLPQVSIIEYGWPEKRAPSLEKLCSLCKAIDSWLSNDRSRNIIIIYSKRDLSRASLAVAVFLQYVKICLGNDSYFDFETMYNYFHFNLENYLYPSQRRYVNYFKSLLSGESRINGQKFHLNQIVLRKIPNFDGNGFCKPFIKIYQGLNLIYSSSIINIDQQFTKTWDFIVFNIDPPLKLRGEILIKCYHKIMQPSSRTEMFSFQFHMGVLTDNIVVFQKNDIDIAIYDKRFHDDTRVELIFNDQNLELIQNVEFLQDDQITKCNSYENFFQDGYNLEYTKGPLDGSLYATVKKPISNIIVTPPSTSPTSPVLAPSTTELTKDEKLKDEGVLDELLNELFTEIKSFPDTSPSTSFLKTSEDQDFPKIDLDSLNVNGNGIKDHKITEPIVDGDETDYGQLDWLQRQQRKLKMKQTKKDFLQKRMIDELKTTIVNHNNNKALPEVPARTSSRNIFMEFDPENDSNLNTISTLRSDQSSSYDVVDYASSSDYQTYLQPISSKSEQTSTAKNSLLKPVSNLVRSSTPSFPVKETKDKKTETVSLDVSSTSTGPLFVKDTSGLWYRPNLSRDEVITFLYDKEPGSFIIRDSNSFPNSYGLAIKVPLSERRNNSDPVRHFLIESTKKGVQIKGCDEEPVFSSLAALVYQHSLTRISLPIVLRIPSTDDIENNIIDDVSSYLKRLFENGAACNVLYFTSTNVDFLDGSIAIKKIIDNMFEHTRKVRPAIIHFKASSKGITLTDNSHRLFFRRHYPIKSLINCSMDSENRFWLFDLDKNQKLQSYLFGFVSRKRNVEKSLSECHIFGQYELDQPSHAIVDFVNKLMENYG